MEISTGIEIIDLALYLKKENVLILADTHIGYEEALNKQGILIPRFQFKEIIERLERILNLLSKGTSARGWGTSAKSKKERDNIKNNKLLDKIIINGDIKHEFGTISDQEWRHTLRLLDFLSTYAEEIILISLYSLRFNK